MVRAVSLALLLSFVAEGLALLTGRIPYISGLAVLASLSYLVEAFDRWRQERQPVPAPVPAPRAATSVVLGGPSSITLSAGGPRRLAPLQEPGGSRDAAEQGTHVGDGAVEVVDLGAELADDRHELLQRA